MGNGTAQRKEEPHQSFLKFTAHQFKKILMDKHPAWLQECKVEAVNQHYQFWQRDSLAFPLFSRAVINQKIDYLHNNLLSSKWQLAATTVFHLLRSMIVAQMHSNAYRYSVRPPSFR